MLQAFISSSSKDRHIAEAACDKLEKEGFKCWIAPRDILPGKDWGKSIVDAIRESQAVVLIFSANANRSTHVKNEVNCAVDENVPIIVFRVEDVKPDGALKLNLTRYHWLDAIKPSWEMHLQKLAADLKTLLEPEKEPDASLEPKKEPDASEEEITVSKKILIIASIVAGVIVFIIIIADGGWFSSDSDQSNILQVNSDLNRNSTDSNSDFPANAMTPNINVNNAVNTNTKPSVIISNLSDEQYIVENGETGMTITVELTTNGYYKKKLNVRAYFYDSNGEPLVYDDGTKADNLSAYKGVIIDSSIRKVQIFIPYLKFSRKKGKHQLTYSIDVKDDDKGDSVAKSDSISFTYTGS